MIIFNNEIKQAYKKPWIKTQGTPLKLGFKMEM